MKNEVQQLERANRLLIIALISITGLLAIASAIAGYTFYDYKIRLEEATSQNRELIRKIAKKAIEKPTSQAQEVPPIPKHPPKPEKVVIRSIETKATLDDITWFKEWRKLDDLSLFTTPQPYMDIASETSYYAIGTIESGPYAGGEIVLGSIIVNGMGSSTHWYRFIVIEESYLVLEEHSNLLKYAEHDYEEFNLAKVMIAPNISIPVLQYPRMLTGPRGVVLERTFLYIFNSSEARFDGTGLVVAFEDRKYGTAYTDTIPTTEGAYGKYGFYFRAPDGMLQTYTIKIPFQRENSVPDITWNDETKNIRGYASTDRGGCGSRNLISIVYPETISAENDLEKIGTAQNGDTIWGLKNSNHKVLRDFYENKYYAAKGEKVSYDTFVTNRPLVFWIDPFDRLVKFESEEFLPQAECAKPVIYLYPTSPLDVSVTIDPQGGLTKTEPQYDGKWNVYAKPDGTLIEKETGKTYPYLFWEGRGALYETPSRGFVAAQSDVHGFLVEKLTLLGLNRKEQADFLEYWLPYFSDAPYYFITFVPERAIDILAPLTVIPTPDTIIRVLMDFKPLDAPIEVEGFPIQAPERSGFTVVEWGGVKQ